MFPLGVGDPRLEQMLQTAITSIGNSNAIIATLLAMPTNQGLTLRPGRWIGSITTAREIVGFLVQLKGTIQCDDAACFHCEDGSGPFVECVWVPGRDNPWGCGNREFQNERTNCQLAAPNHGCITLKMINRAANFTAGLDAKCRRIAPRLRQEYATWSGNEILTFDHPITVPAFAQEAVRRVLQITGTPNHLAPAAPGYPVLSNLEITEITAYRGNALTKANILRNGPALANLTPDKKFRRVAEGDLAAGLVLERTETWVLAIRDPAYIFMVQAEQKMVLDEIRDMFDRRFTEAVVRALGATYAIVCVAGQNSPKTLDYFRLQGDRDFKFDRGAGVTWKKFNQTQRAKIPAIP